MSIEALVKLKTLLDGVIHRCAAEIQGRWLDKPAGVDAFGSSHCRAASVG